MKSILQSCPLEHKQEKYQDTSKSKSEILKEIYYHDKVICTPRVQN